MADKKTCTKCQIDYPLNKDFWHRDNHASDGFRSTCKMCRAEELESKRKEKASETIERIEGEGVDLLDTMIKGGSDVPHMGETFQRIMEAFGGPGGLAQQIAGTFYRAAPGSQQRQRILEAVLRLNIKVSESGAAQKSFEELTNEELDQEIEKSVRSVVDPDMQTLYKLRPSDEQSK